MKRRKFLKEISGQALAAAYAAAAFRGGAHFAAAAGGQADWIDPATARGWLARWEKYILGAATSHRYRDTEMGEELGWLLRD